MIDVGTSFNLLFKNDQCSSLWGEKWKAMIGVGGDNANYITENSGVKIQIWSMESSKFSFECMVSLNEDGILSLAGKPEEVS